MDLNKPPFYKEAVKSTTGTFPLFSQEAPLWMFATILSMPPKGIIHLVSAENFSKNYYFSVSGGKKC